MATDPMPTEPMPTEPIPTKPMATELAGAGSRDGVAVAERVATLAAGAVARLVVDADDERDCVRELSRRHDPATGVLVGHPTPGPGARSELGADLLVALGKDPAGPVAEGLSRQAWELASVWLAAERIRHLIVLRAHRLSAERWHDLAALGSDIGAVVWLVSHRADITTAHRGVLTGWAAAAPQATPWRWLSAALAPRPAAAGQTVVFPMVPDVDFPLFRAAARSLLDPAAFARVDTVYREVVQVAGRDARDWRRARWPIMMITDAGGGVVQRLTVDAGSDQEVLTRWRGLQAGFFSAGLLLGLRAGARHADPAAELVPRLEPGTAARLRQLYAPTAAAALAIVLVTGLRAEDLHRLRCDQVVVDGDAIYLVARGGGFRVPASVAGLVRAALVERGASPYGAPRGRQGGVALFSTAGGPVAVRVLQRLLERAADRAGVDTRPRPFPAIQVTDLWPSAGR